MSAYNTVGFSAASASVAMVAGTGYAIPITAGVRFGGPAFIVCQLNSTVVKGLWSCNSSALGLTLGDTSEPEAHTIFGQQILYKLCAFPLAAFTMTFFATTGGAATVASLTAMPNY